MSDDQILAGGAHASKLSKHVFHGAYRSDVRSRR